MDLQLQGKKANMGTIWDSRNTVFDEGNGHGGISTSTPISYD